MTKTIACLLFYATAILLKNIHIYFACLPLSALNFSCPTNQPKQLRYLHTRFNVLSTVLPPLYRVSISNFFICATKCYREMSSLNPFSVHGVSRQYSSQLLGCQVIIEQKVCEILFGYLEILF
jgi:hypothetical protein